jgi:DNA-binding NtrC family response regulator
MSDAPLRVLLVEDDEDDYVLTRGLFQQVAGRPFVLDWVSDFDEALEAIGECRHDVYLLDYRLGRRTGLELLREAVAWGCRGPLILLTGRDDRETDVEAMRAGAADFLTKGRMDAAQLERAIRYAVEQKRVEEEIRRLNRELEDRVRQRTEELVRANAELRAEVAERRRAEEAAEAASRAKSQFLAVLSHELRTPLTPVIVGLTELLEDPGSSPALRAALETIKRNVELEARLIDDLLDVTRIAQGKLRIRTTGRAGGMRKAP